jgi:hypothetical protein
VDIGLHLEVEAWFLDLCITDSDSAGQVAEAIDLLAEHGPSLGRPLVDRLKGSAYHNMKELRPGSAGATEVRLIFALTPPEKPSSWSAGTNPGNGRRGIRRRSRWPTCVLRSIWQR